MYLFDTQTNFDASPAQHVVNTQFTRESSNYCVNIFFLFALVLILILLLRNDEWSSLDELLALKTEKILPPVLLLRL